MKQSILYVLALGGILAADVWAKPVPLSAVDVRPSLCSPAEAEIATCHVGPKLASVCGLRRGEAVYRFGRPGRIELEANGLRYSRQMYSGGGETQVYFARGAYRYILYDLMYRTNFNSGEPNNPATVRGFVLQKGDRFQVLSRCPKVDPVIVSGKVGDYVPEGPFIEHDELNR